MTLPGQLYAAILRSPHGHARIRKIDTAPAKAAPGVVAAFTGVDAEGVIGAIPCAWLVPNSDLKTAPYPPLAKEIVRYVGDAVAVVVAESPQQAADAVAACSRLIDQHVRRTGHGRSALGSLVLRSLKQAYYSPRNLGHAGLASPRYCHFTSPIRRYPDLVAHRALLASLGLDDAAPRGDALFEAGEHSSATERDAMRIERDADDVCLAFLLQRRLHDAGWEAEFDGEVVGVISSGAFVRFGDDGFEGFLPVRRMRGDWYQLNDAETALVGEDSGRAFRLGDPLRVRVGRVDAPRGRAELELAPD
jgi:ribonuclease R